MGPGFESQRDHKASTKVGVFLCRNANQACLNERMRHKKTNATKGCVKRLCASSMRKGRRRSATEPTIPDMKCLGRRRSATEPTFPNMKCFWTPAKRSEVDNPRLTKFLFIQFSKQNFVCIKSSKRN